jgi:hypothetical protein
MRRRTVRTKFILAVGIVAAAVLAPRRPGFGG